MQFQNYWNKTYDKFSSHKIIYDNWLDKYQKVLNECKTPILDLGCGCGNNTLYLAEKGFKVVACDYSEVALKKINQNIKNVETMLVDISKTLPFKDEAFNLIIADLSLHYFDEKTTKNILQEIKRILTPNGNLLARVNSTLDINHGAGQGKELEKNYYFVEGYNKRFFTLKDAKEYFSIIGKTEVKEDDMLRYEKPKKVIEIKVKKIL